jgi:N-acetylglutamate synthase-like GNAT family acetyltransferase
MGAALNAIKRLTPDQYGLLIDVSRRNDLEEPTPEDLAGIKAAWGIIGQDGILLASVALLERENCWVLDCLAVDASFRGTGLGRQLVALAEASIQAVELTFDLYLVTKVPGFFSKLGYYKLPRSEAPDFSECFRCERYQVTCFPEVMQKQFH